jgi:hypothetical protein
VKITARSSLKKVAAVVSNALSGAGIRAVLTGGACATIYSGGAYQSEDLDLILQSSPTQKELDRVMAEIGFVRQRDSYHHPDTRFFVEFPRGPLSIGADLSVKPAEMPIGGVSVLLLSPTDSCRDRLAAYYHWKDRQSLKAAVAVASRHRIDLDRTRSWSAREGATQGFNEFVEEVRKARARRRR